MDQLGQHRLKIMEVSEDSEPTTSKSSLEILEESAAQLYINAVHRVKELSSEGHPGYGGHSSTSVLAESLHGQVAVFRESG